MARKRGKQSRQSLPLMQGEVWEIGRRTFEVYVTDLAQQNERPEILLAVQTGDSGGVVQLDAITSSTPMTAMKDFIHQAMQQPMLGQPRRPEVIRVGSQAEAEMLAVELVNTGIAVEVVSQFAALDAVHESMGTVMSGLSCDYRTRAAQVGETLSIEGLQAFFRTAGAFYREAIWEAYDDEVLFEITLQAGRKPAKTLYGVLLGSLGEEFGLTLFPSLDAFRQFYELSVEHLDQFTDLPQEEADAEVFDPKQWQDVADITAQFMGIPSVTLTYSQQQEAPQPLVKEAKQLKLPLANKSAFPVVMCMCQGGMQMATATELNDMLAAMQAILEWDKRIDDMIEEDEIDVTVTSKLKAVKGFAPAITAHATLRHNPCFPEADDDDENWFPSALDSLFETLFTETPDRKPAAKGKKSGKTSSEKKINAAQKGAKTNGSNRVYTLNVYLNGGPVAETYADQEISRTIDIRGNQTLHDLHRAIFNAFDRWEEHLYEFNLGVGPADRSQIYFYSGGWETDDDKGGNPETTVLDALDLEIGRHFGYTFDMGDQWEHVIEVVAVKKNAGKGEYPQVVKKVGTAPPQYPEDDEDDDEW